MSLNKVMIIGNAGRDPEISYQTNGSAIAKLSIATSEKWMDKATGGMKENTEWHNVVFFGKQAETIGKYMRKGKQLYVEGRLQTRSYEKDGVTRYFTEIVAREFQFIGSPDKQQAQPQNSSGFQNNNQGFQQESQQSDGLPF